MKEDKEARKRQIKEFKRNFKIIKEMVKNGLLETFSLESLDTINHNLLAFVQKTRDLAIEEVMKKETDEYTDDGGITYTRKGEVR